MKWLIREDYAKIDKETEALAVLHNKVVASLQETSPEADEQKSLLRLVLLGAVPSNIKSEAIDKLAKAFSSLHPTDETFKLLLDATGNQEKSREIIYDLVAEKLLRRKVEEIPVREFSETLHIEHTKQRVRLDALTSRMREIGDKEFDIDRLFIELGVGHGRVIRTNKLRIIPFFANSGISLGTDYEKNTPWSLDIGGSSEFGGYKYALGFIEGPAEDKKGRKKVLWDATLAIDRRVCHALQDFMDIKTISVEKKLPKEKFAAMEIEQLLGNFLALTIHDYGHHAMYGDAYVFGGKEYITMDGPPKNYLESRGARSFIAGSHAPLYEGNERSYEKESIWPMDSGVFGGVSSLEMHAELLNRDIWYSIYAGTEPDGRKIKDNILKQGVTFLVNLEEFRKAVIDSQGPEVAEGMASFLAVVAMNRFYRLIQMKDPDLKQRKVTLRDGREMTFEEAGNRLGLQEYTPNYQDIKEYEKLDPVYSYFSRKVFDTRKRMTPAEIYKLFDGTQILDKFVTEELSTSAKPGEGEHEEIKLACVKTFEMLCQGLVLKDQEISWQDQRAVTYRYMFLAENNLPLPSEFKPIGDLLAKYDMKPKTAGWNAAMELLAHMISKERKETKEYPNGNSSTRWIQAPIVEKYGKHLEDAIRARITEPYALGRFSKWTGKRWDEIMQEDVERLSLSGYEGLEARVLAEGSRVPAWLNCFKTGMQDAKYNVAEINQKYYANWTGEEVQQRRAFQEALADHYRAVSEMLVAQEAQYTKHPRAGRNRN